MYKASEKFEKLYEKLYFNLFSIIVLIIIFEIYNYTGSENIFGSKLFEFKWGTIIFLTFFLTIKLAINLSQEKSRGNYFYVYRVWEVLVVLATCLFFTNHRWLYTILMLPIIFTSVCRGAKAAIILTGCAFLTNIIVFVSYKILIMDIFVDSFKNIPFKNIYKELFSHSTFQELRSFAIYYLIMFMLALVSGKKHKDLAASEFITDDSEPEMNIEKSYNKLFQSSEILDDKNSLLAESNAELFTMQYIVRKINSIINMKELSSTIIDIVNGIMGASCASMLFYDKTKNRFRLVASTIQSREELLIISENINCYELENLMLYQEGIYNNSPKADRFPFVAGRDIGSLMLIPMSRDSKKVGILIIEHKMKEYFDEDKMNLMNVVGQQFLIAIEKAELYNRLHEMAMLDGLTGIYNRVYFQSRLNEEIISASKSGKELSLVVLDIDFFKKFNDTHGHLFGDRVLKHTVDVVKSSLRKSDIIARFGGEEFVIVFPSTPARESFKKIEEIRETLAKSILIEDNINVSVTASFGLASFPSQAQSGDELIRAADSALYEAKNSGRNCVRISKIIL